jgi:hypothetical protein
LAVLVILLALVEAKDRDKGGMRGQDKEMDSA